MIVKGARHGTRHGYRDDRCKCDACKRAIALDHNVYQMRRAANGGAPLTVDKLGAVRRLQALMAMGWPRRELARLAGYQGDAFALVLNGRRQRLTLESFKRIDDLYERLSMTHGPSSSSRIRAQKKGFAPPLAWDDIDDPAERPSGRVTVHRKTDVDPVAVERAMAGDRIQLTRDERYEVVARLRNMGRSLGWIEEHTVITKAERYLARGDAA